MRFHINGTLVEAKVDADMPLLWFLRDHQHLIGTKFGCGIGSCGACTVHVDGEAIRSCSVPLRALEGRSVTTIEALASDGRLHPVQQAWVDLNVPQCGYCQAGQIMAVTRFLERFPTPTDDQIDSHLTNLCRCGTYTRIRKAVHRAAELLRKQSAEVAS